MFNLTFKFLLIASFLILGGVSAANAQMANGSVLSVDIPTSFTVKDKTFEAGRYTIERTPSTIDSGSLLILRGANGNGIVFDTTQAKLARAANETELVFEGAAGNNFLTRIIFKGQEAAIELPKTKAQRQALTQASATTLRVVLTQDTGF